jgi:hypothetical protein
MNQDKMLSHLKELEMEIKGRVIYQKRKMFQRLLRRMVKKKKIKRMKTTSKQCRSLGRESIILFLHSLGH